MLIENPALLKTLTDCITTYFSEIGVSHANPLIRDGVKAFLQVFSYRFPEFDNWMLLDNLVFLSGFCRDYSALWHLSETGKVNFAKAYARNL